MLSMNRMSSCGIPFNVQVGDLCYFWWDNGNGQNDQVLTNAEWGIMDLDHWDVAANAGCPGNTSQSEFGTWVSQGYPGTLALRDPPPTYVCRASGFQGNALINDINAISGQIRPFPVNDPNQQVQSNGSPCPPGANCTVHKYAIIGFGALEIVRAYSGQQALNNCPPPPFPYTGRGSLRCLVARWRGFQPGGIVTGTGQNFGLLGVALLA
jgi:hypothetical protein